MISEGDIGGDMLDISSQVPVSVLLPEQYRGGGGLLPVVTTQLGHGALLGHRGQVSCRHLTLYHKF